MNAHDSNQLNPIDFNSQEPPWDMSQGGPVDWDNMSLTDGDDVWNDIILNCRTHAKNKK